MNDTVVVIVSAFFVIGILVGIVTVIAAAVLRADRRRRGDNGVDPEDRPDYEPGEPDDPWDDTTPDDHSRWPGDADTDFRGR
jgi:MFS superfamily sulfate permease-like transporter